MTGFQDLFSHQAGCYAMSRPRYPAALFEFLAGKVHRHHLAWDVGAGNGQAAVGLAAHFDRVIATDGSDAQIALAVPHPRVEYHVALAESAGPDEGLADGVVNLVTIAQALHWFAHESFFSNVRRVLAPGGIVAAWCYGIHTTGTAVDAVTDRFYREITGPYWPPDRKWIDERYETIPFPFEATDRDRSEGRSMSHFECREEWTLAQYVGYLQSWSAVQRFRDARGTDPLDEIADDLRSAWGDPGQRRGVTWPIFMRIGHASNNEVVPE